MKRCKMSFVGALSLIAATYAVQAPAQESHLPFSKVIDYLRAEKSNTSYQNHTLAKELVGKIFEGDIQVTDVGGSPQLVQIYADFPASHAQLEFLVGDPHLKEVAAKLSPGSELRMTGTLQDLGSYIQYYINVPATYIATFQNVTFQLSAKKPSAPVPSGPNFFHP
jgi:hypothetical protein